MIFALFIAVVLLLLGTISIYRQILNLRGLRQPHIPSDERSYRRRQVIRRLVNSFLLLILGGMLAGTFLSGIEKRAEDLGNRHLLQKQNPDAPRQETSPEDKQFLRFYAYYWITILFLLFLVVSISIVDMWATRRYAWAQLRRIQSEHRALLERDLAVYRQQKRNDRMRGRTSGPEPSEGE